MAELPLEESIDAESFFSKLEDEITELFEKLATSIEDKRQSILGTFERIREEYKHNTTNRLNKLTELRLFKNQLLNTDSQQNDVMEIFDDTINKLDAKISKYILPEECPKVILQCDELERIIAKIDTIQLKTITDEDEPTFETSLDQTLEANISIIRRKLQLSDHDRKSLVRHMSTLRRDSTIQTRPITDIKIASNKQNIPVGYTALDSTAGGKEVDLWEEARFRVFTSRPKRYLCYTRQTMDALSIKEGTSKRSRLNIPESDQIVVTDILVVSSTTKEFIPLDYEVVECTVDLSEQAIHYHNLLVKYQKKLETQIAVSQIMFLAEEQVSCLPPKFSSVNHPINGYYLCFNTDMFDAYTNESSESMTSPAT